MPKGGLTNVIRDLLYEGRGSSVTVAEVMESVNALRYAAAEKPSDDGAVRRAMEAMVRQAMLHKKTDSKPARYEYAKGDAVPKDYVPYAQRMATAQTLGTPEMRAKLHKKLAGRMGQVTGRSVDEPEAEDTGPPPVTIVTRPNGQEYRVRAIADKPDVEMLRTLRANEIWALLYGPPGTGKTALVEAAFGEDAILFPGDENTTVDDLFGTWVGDGDGSWMWVDGPVCTAMKEGKVIFMDDITLIGGRVLGALYPAMDGRDQIVIKTHMVDTDENGKPWADGKKHPEIVKAQPGFYIVGAHNPGTNGAILSEALSSRFQWQMEIDSDLDLAAAAGVPPEIMFVAKTLKTCVEEHHITWMPQLRELFQAMKIAEVTGSLELALSNLAGLAPEDDREFILQKIRSIAGTAIVPLKIGKQL
jgi:hypothetical protein